MKKKTAMILGVTGQDGSHLSDLLLNKGYIVYGVKRRSSSFNTQRIDHIYNSQYFNTKFFPFYADLTDSSSLLKIIQSTKPDEIYNLSAQSHVHTSFETPEYTANTDAIGSLRVLEAIKILKLINKTKYYQASTSEIFGNTQIPQKESTPFRPTSPYAISKLYAYWTTINYRESYGMFAVNGILFNHEGPRRGETFVTRKITRAVAKIYKEKKGIIYLGNLNAKRDWGYAVDYVESMWKMMQQKKPDDYVIATGKSHSIKEFINYCTNILDLKTKWVGSGLNEKLINVENKKILVQINKKFFRPAEVNYLRGNCIKAKKMLKWKPKKNLKELAQLMLSEDIKFINAS